jgi:hypothetical protein
MSAELIQKMRGRVEQCRRIAEMAHDPEMIRLLLQMAEEGEADIAKLEAELAAVSVTLHVGPPPMIQ